MKHTKQMISVRIEEHDRIMVQALASRLFIRESDIYRLAISNLCARLNWLIDSNYYGSELLLPLVEIRYELRNILGFKKQQLERIINNTHSQPDKYIAMSDIELLLMPDHTLRQCLLRLYPKSKDNLNIDEWLIEYLSTKYELTDTLSYVGYAPHTTAKPNG